MLWNQAPAAAQLPPPPPPPATLWSFLGVPQGYRYVRDNAFNRRGQRPGLERKPPLKAIADPQNLKSPDAAIKKAAEVKQAEDLKQQKIKAIRYLAQIGCGCYNRDGSITDAMLKAMDDCTEEVRWAAITAISEAATGEMCANCKQKSCCSEEITKKLYQIAYERDETGCFLEPSERVRNAAAEAMRACCPGGGDEMYFESAPVPATSQPLQPEQPSVLPPADVERPATGSVPGIPAPPVPPAPSASPLVPLNNPAPIVPPQAAAPIAPPVISEEAPQASIAQAEQQPRPRIVPAARAPAIGSAVTAARPAKPREMARPPESAELATETQRQPAPQTQPQRSSRRTASLLATAALPTNRPEQNTIAAEPTSPPATPVATLNEPAAPAAEPSEEATPQALAQSIQVLAPAGQAQPIGEIAPPPAAADKTPAGPTVTVRLAGTNLRKEQAPATLAPIVTSASLRRLQPVDSVDEERSALPEAAPSTGGSAQSSRRSAQLPIRIGMPVTR